VHADILGNTAANNVRGGHTVHTVSDYNNNDTDNHGYWGVNGANGAGDLSGSRCKLQGENKRKEEGERGGSQTAYLSYPPPSLPASRDHPPRAPASPTNMNMTNMTRFIQLVCVPVQASTTRLTFPEAAERP